MTSKENRRTGMGQSLMVCGIDMGMHTILLGIKSKKVLEGGQAFSKKQVFPVCSIQGEFEVCIYFIVNFTM
ncbi:MAG: hypothetical protein ACOCX0_04945 [Bacteroidota bacterium]